MATRRVTRPVMVFATFWLVGLALMVQSYVANPVDPSLRGTSRYGASSIRVSFSSS